MDWIDAMIGIKPSQDLLLKYSPTMIMSIHKKMVPLLVSLFLADRIFLAKIRLQEIVAE